MEEESFEDETVASLLNKDFISVKVDREERPDIDAVYMSVCQAMTGSGGWPMTIFMTPGQTPFYAATYLPKKSAYGRMGMVELLPKIAELWKQSPERLKNTGKEIIQYLNRQQHTYGESGQLNKELIHKALHLYEESFDPEYGGFGRAPKFPTPHNLLFLLRYSVLELHGRSREMAEKTLEQMYRGGIFDHIGGGFSRYSTDEKWLVPHFEKMLYDNALLAYTYAEAYQMTGRTLYKEISERTLDYIKRELTDELGGFFCGQDADSDGVEGKYYVFTTDEIKKLLGITKGGTFCQLFGITSKGNFEDKNIPNLLHILGRDLTSPVDEKTLQKVYDYRLSRTKLHTDDKVLTSWNSLAIAAFAKAGRVLDRPDYLERAKNASFFIEKYLTNASGRLYVRWRDGEAAFDGQLDDYAFYSYALLELYESTFNVSYLEKALTTAQKMIDMFFDPSNGGFFLYAHDGEPLILRPKETYDGALPSGNSVAAWVLEKLKVLTGERHWKELSEKQLNFLYQAARQYPAGYSFSLLAMCQALYPAKKLVCVLPDSQIPKELTSQLARYRSPDLTILVKTPENQKLLEQLVPSAKDYPIDPKAPTYYLCHNETCQAPTHHLKLD